MNSFYIIALLSMTALAVSAPGRNSKGMESVPYPELVHFMGSTSNKEFYITKAVSADYATALHHTCINIFQMHLAAVETQEELTLIEDWLRSETGNDTNSPKAWTSGIAFGSEMWASTSNPINLTVERSYPWPAGGSASPSWSWNQCLSIYQKCTRPPNVPIPGCFPLRTELFYDDCRSERQVICQRRI